MPAKPNLLCSKQQVKAKYKARSGEMHTNRDLLATNNKILDINICLVLQSVSLFFCAPPLVDSGKESGARKPTPKGRPLAQDHPCVPVLTSIPRLPLVNRS